MDACCTALVGVELLTVLPDEKIECRAVCVFLGGVEYAVSVPSLNGEIDNWGSSVDRRGSMVSVSA